MHRGIGVAPSLSHEVTPRWIDSDLSRGRVVSDLYRGVSALMDELVKSRDSASVRTLDRKTSAASANLWRTWRMSASLLILSGGSIVI